MAKKDNKPLINSRVRKMSKNIQSNIDNLYTSTFFNDPKGNKDLDALSSSINSSIDKIISNNISSTGIPNISKLYSRVYSSSKNKNLMGSMEDLFNDDGLMSNVMESYMKNKYLKDFDNEIDTVCKYMPKLEEALNAKKDNVLSADQFTKDFINITNDTNTSDLEIFSDRISDLKENYDLLNFFDTVYDRAAKYGEAFVYAVPYKKAMAKLLANKGNTMVNSQVNTEQGMIITEGAQPFVMEGCQDAINEIYGDRKENLNINIELNMSNVIDSAVRSYQLAENRLKSINESAVNALDTDNGIGNSNKFTKTIDDELSFEKMVDDKKNGLSDDTAAEGLVNSSRKIERKLKVPGCVLKMLDRSHVVPIYIEDICLGYYYFEFAEYDDSFTMTSSSVSDPLASLKMNNVNTTNETDYSERNQMLRYVSGQISQFIDTRFINSNQDLRKEIYMMLKHSDIFNTPSNDKFRVTFIPPEDMIHVYFKMDPHTHRGISDLEKALFPAKIYSTLYISNAIATMTRGVDRRVYYVKQTVDTNIASLLLNTINQIKKSNFGIRQVENINHVLNIIGKFNDFVIPKSASNESPVDFEIMPGQDIRPPSELMEILENMAINSTDIPVELINSLQSVDYASRLTMSNSKFLKAVYNRQGKFQKFMSRIISIIYNSEYNTQSRLSVTLPPPMFLNLNNTNQLISNTKEYVNSIWEEDTSDVEDETVKNIYKRKLLQYHLGSYINVAKHQELFKEAEQEAKAKQKEVSGDNMDSSEPSGGGDSSGGFGF